MCKFCHVCWILIGIQQFRFVEEAFSCENSLIDFYYRKHERFVCNKGETITNGNNLKETLQANSVNKENMASGSNLDGLYRPRSALARAMYEKQRNDRYLQEYDHSEWYRVDKNLLSPEVQKKFVQLDPDEETKEFLSNSIEKSTWVWTQIWYLLAKAVLRHFWSITDINGWLGRGSMFVLSEAQARTLLNAAELDISCQETDKKLNDMDKTSSDKPAERRRTLVDIGAGDGEVSRRFAHLFETKYATEISGSMRKALSRKGYTLLDTEDWWRDSTFDCICMLNLLDRCSKPKTMLEQARQALAPHGVLLLALVLPFKPYVEVNRDHKPEERLPIEGPMFEQQLESFVTFMREEAGFELASWTRAPYLCEGDFSQAYYWLNDSVYVFKPIVKSDK